MASGLSQSNRYHAGIQTSANADVVSNIPRLLIEPDSCRWSEPATCALLGGGLVALRFARRRNVQAIQAATKPASFGKNCVTSHQRGGVPNTVPTLVFLQAKPICPSLDRMSIKYT